MDAKVRDYEAFTNKLKTICEDRNYALNLLGEVEEYPIYLVDINPSAKTTLCFIGGLHGNEEAGPLGILSWLKEGTPPDVRMLIVPLLNAYGYEKNIRRNAYKKDPNRQFCNGKDSPDSALIRDLLLNNDIKFLCTLHEDPSKKAFYLYCSDDTLELNKAAIELASTYFKINAAKTIYGEKSRGGIVWELEGDSKGKPRPDCSVEVWANRTLGIPYIVTETPGKMLLTDRVEFMRNFIDLVLRTRTKN